MIKISLRHPSGLEIDFEGDDAAFDRFVQFLASDVGPFVGGFTPGNQGNRQVLPLTMPGQSTERTYDKGPIASNASTGSLDARAIASDIERLGAKTDIERTTVIALAATDAGLEGIDYPTIDRLYTELGFPKPARFAKTFSNARSRGLVRSVKHGVWAPTVIGENYVRHGKKWAQRPRRGASSGSPELPEATVALTVSGGDPSED